MRKSTLLLAAISFAFVALSAAVYARDPDDGPSSMMGSGMMGGRGMVGGRMIGRMSGMMDRCGAMMRGSHSSGRPNDQWRNPPSREDGSKE
ncbi:hypothetical protein [Bradyrhizobium sp. WSM1253]|uniref:hypothetical protein n=1 Tax=Bradyrhizobium sp. WSM1253 TaxID=319003 RepID=UPI00025D305D|nr:hypothetical protein [Bradyrhizobium sp. WSM1253]EIG62833.1 hypothetical protein Bra1253DRAFT_07773 [Bradyrhizobium sp. WSM1253]